MKFSSPLRYPGGKGKLSNYIASLINANYIYDGVYIEPFAGGAAVALDLVFGEHVRKSIINDYDYSIYCIWDSILNDTDNFMKLIYEAGLNIEEWECQKKIYDNPSEHTRLEIGFAAFYLNRTNRSGIIKGGVIGGKLQTGKYKIDARFNKAELIRRIERIGIYRNRFELYNYDVIDLISNVISQIDHKRAFIYFDPPYYKKGKELYVNFYNDDDHEELRNKIRELENYKWIVTYDNEEFVKTLYKENRMAEYSLNYSLANKGSAKELIIYSDNTIITGL